jgi:UDP-N-acetylmuramate dehydrogenase
MPGVILSATFKLKEDPHARKKQIELIAYRQQTQPYNEKSAGSVFQNPPEGYAGALIEKSGLKGITIGGAQVSRLHGNFFINTGMASAQDVLSLMEFVKKQVKITSGVDLHSELLYIPFGKKI